MKRAVLILCLILPTLSGCMIHAMDVKTLTIPPSKNPVTVTVKGTATCQDFFLFFVVKENLDILSSGGQKAN